MVAEVSAQDVESAGTDHCPAMPSTIRPHAMKPNPPGAVASLVCGILAVLFAYVPVLGVVLGIAAMINAGRARRALADGPELWLPSGLPIAGQVCGIIGAIMSSLATLWAVVVFGIIAAIIGAMVNGMPAHHVDPVWVPKL